jgi:hypothetical protein
LRSPALILSSGRTGTQFLARYLDANYASVTAVHEPSPARLLRVASHAHLAGRLSRDHLAWLLRTTRGRSLASEDELYVESNPFLAGFVDVFDAVWDDPILIHVVRDPREHARSSLNHGTGSGWKGIANRFVPFWYPDVQRILGLPERPSWLGQAAGVWMLFNRLLLEHGPRYPRYHRLRYEDLFTPSRGGLRQLCEILGLEFREHRLAIEASQRINASRGRGTPPWREWTSAACRELDTICGPLAATLGYCDEPEWRARLEAER